MRFLLRCLNGCGEIDPSTFHQYDRYTLELYLNAMPWAGGGRTLEDRCLSAALGAAEMVRKGCTASYDMFAEFRLPTPDGVAVGSTAASHLAKPVPVFTIARRNSSDRSLGWNLRYHFPMANLATELRLPYGWSNPHLADEKVIAAALDRAVFDHVLRLAIKVGVPVLRDIAGKLTPDALRDVALTRMLRNIEIGLSRA